MDGRLDANRPPERFREGGVRIVEMSSEDVPAYARIVAETPLWKRYGLDFESASSNFLRALSEKQPIFVARLDNEVVGFVWTIPKGMFGAGGYIKLIGVDGAHRGAGIGTALLRHAEQFLGQFNRDVFLLVSDFNTAARRFYLRNGYIEVGRLPDYAVQGITEILMWKRLNPAPRP